MFVFVFVFVFVCPPRISVGRHIVAPADVPFSFVLVDANNNRPSACWTNEAMPTRFVAAALSRGKSDHQPIVVS